MMKSLVKNQHLLSAFLLTGVLSISTSLSLVQNATAATQKNSASNITTKGELISDRRSNDDNRDRRSNDDNDRRGGNTSSQLPDRVANAVLVDLSKQTTISTGQLQGEHLSFANSEL